MQAPHTRAIDPATGDLQWDTARGTWAEAVSPELAIVQNVLRTPLGTAARDRTYGVELVDTASPSAASLWRQNVLRALRRWIDAGVLRDVRVESEVLPAAEGHALVYRVIFRTRRGAVATYAGRVE